MVVTGTLTALEAAYRTVYVGVLIFLALMIFLCLIRAVKGPSVADRIVAVNMMGTMVMVIIAILALMLKEGYLVDICLIYAMISFLAVIVLTNVYMGVHSEKKSAEGGTENGKKEWQITASKCDPDRNDKRQCYGDRKSDAIQHEGDRLWRSRFGDS